MKKGKSPPIWEKVMKNFFRFDDMVNNVICDVIKRKVLCDYTSFFGLDYYYYLSYFYHLMHNKSLRSYLIEQEIISKCVLIIIIEGIRNKNRFKRVNVIYH